jgi:hypothetical protein
MPELALTKQWVALKKPEKPEKPLPAQKHIDYVMQEFTERTIHMAYKTPEQIAAAILIPLGFVLVNLALMPYSFTDKEGVVFQAMADFYHPGLDLYVEVKCDHLNGKTSKAKAELAYNRIEPAKRYGKHAAYYQVRHQWNHAASKQAVVQSVIGSPQFAIVFTKRPDEETFKRIEKQGIQAFSLSTFENILGLQLALEGNASKP